MPVAATKVRLATLQMLIEGSKHAYPEAPNTVNMTDMPCWVTLTGPGSYPQEGEQDEGEAGAMIVKVHRQYKMLLLAAPFGTGIAGEAERIAEPFIDRTKLFFASRPSLGGLDGLQSFFVTGDSGVSIITYQDTKYYGVSFDASVIEYEFFTYADLE